MADLSELLGWLSTDTLQSIMHDLEKEWTTGNKDRSVGGIIVLHDFIEDVEGAIKKRIVPIEPPTSSGSLAQITGLLKK